MITLLMNKLIPTLIGNFIPVDIHEQAHHDIVDIILNGVLSSGIIKDNATRHLVLESLLGSAINEDHIELLIKWFESGTVTNSEGALLEDVQISLKHKHSIMQRIWGSEEVDLERKNSLMA